MKRQAIIFYLTLGLAVFAIIDGLFGRGGIDWTTLMIPLLIVGIVFFLYKFPPRKYRKQQPKVKPSARTMAKLSSDRRQSTSHKRKHYPFQVIDGQKGKNEDDYPKYH